MSDRAQKFLATTGYYGDEDIEGQEYMNDPGGATWIKRGVASSHIEIFKDPYCVGAQF